MLFTPSKVEILDQGVPLRKSNFDIFVKRYNEQEDSRNISANLKELHRGGITTSFHLKKRIINTVTEDGSPIRVSKIGDFETDS